MRALVRFVRCFLGFVVGLVAALAVLFRLLPGDQGAYDAALAEAPRCEVLFVGPSYLQVGLVPAIFEEEAARLGRPTHVCKFTRSALRSYELRHDIEVLLAHRWPKLKRVIVDLSLPPNNLGFVRDNWFNQRIVFWHTWRALPWLANFYRESKRGQRSWFAVAPDLVPHLQHVAMNYLGIGRSAAQLKRARVLDRLAGEASQAEAPDTNRLPKRQDDDRDKYDALRAELIARKAKQRARRQLGDDDWPRELERVIRKRGHEPTFMYSPVLITRTPPRPKRSGQRPLSFLDFEDPDRFPELYALEARGRTSHVSKAGAVDYSRDLAREVVKLLEPR